MSDNNLPIPVTVAGPGEIVANVSAPDTIEAYLTDVVKGEKGDQGDPGTVAGNVVAFYYGQDEPVDLVEGTVWFQVQ